MIPFEIVRYLRIPADDGCNLVHPFFRHTEGNQGRGMKTEMAGFQYRGYTPDNSCIFQPLHPAENLSLCNAQPSGNRIPWPGYQREIILKNIEYGQIGPVRFKRGGTAHGFTPAGWYGHHGSS